MSLDIQVLTLLVSFLFGIFFSFELELNYKFIYNKNKFIKIFSSFLFIITNVLIYFILLKKVNYGIFHPYTIISIIIGVFAEHYIHVLISKKLTILLKK